MRVKNTKIDETNNKKHKVLEAALKHVQTQLNQQLYLQGIYQKEIQRLQIQRSILNQKKEAAYIYNRSFIQNSSSFLHKKSMVLEQQYGKISNLNNTNNSATKQLQLEIQKIEKNLHKKLQNKKIQADPIISGLLNKIQQQESKVLTEIQQIKQINLQYKMNQYYQQQIQILEEKAYQHLQNQNKKAIQPKLNNKSIIKAGYTKKMLNLLPSI